MARLKSPTHAFLISLVFVSPIYVAAQSLVIGLRQSLIIWGVFVGIVLADRAYKRWVIPKILGPR